MLYIVCVSGLTELWYLIGPLTWQRLLSGWFRPLRIPLHYQTYITGISGHSVKA